MELLTSTIERKNCSSKSYYPWPSPHLVNQSGNCLEQLNRSSQYLKAHSLCTNKHGN